MPEYINPHPYDLHLCGPDGRKVHIRRGKKVRLDSYFDRYVQKSFLKHAGSGRAEAAKPLVAPPEVAQHCPVEQRPPVRNKGGRSVRSQAVRAAKRRVTEGKRSRIVKRRALSSTKRVVGKNTTHNSTEAFKGVLKKHVYPVSNGIGVGILSYNRPSSLRRLVDSIKKFTDLHKTTIFIADDASDDKNLLTYLNGLDDIVVVRGKERLGIAGNTNRLLRCLDRFPNKLLLNDDVEILAKGWDEYYFDIMQKTGFHHFCFRQPGVYGAKEGQVVRRKGVALTTVKDKPHGAVMAIDHVAFDKVGYFDEVFGLYGIEHVDWSTRVARSGIQEHGFFDAAGANRFFTIHAEKSALEARTEHFRQAKAKYSGMGSRPIYIDPSEKSIVPKVSCVIPFRDIGRRGAILTIVDSVRAQRFPQIEIILVEQDQRSQFANDEFVPLSHILVTTGVPRPFNKSKAFNAGVAACTSRDVILHDADTMAPGHYFDSVHKTLNNHESCHMGDKVYYAGETSAANVIRRGVVDDKTTCDKIVTYFEGGSIACHVKTYWKVGAFVENYWGYGCEDCDFYLRLSRSSVWKEERTLGLLHLHHGRTPGWMEDFAANKELEGQLSRLSVAERVRRQRASLKKHPKYAQFVG